MPFPWLIGAMVVGGIAYAASKLAEDDSSSSGPSYSKQKERAEREALAKQAEREKEQQIIATKKDFYSFGASSNAIFQGKLQPIFKNVSGKFVMMDEDELESTSIPNISIGYTSNLSSASENAIQKIEPLDKKMSDSLREVCSNFTYDLYFNQKSEEKFQDLEKYDALLSTINKTKGQLKELQNIY